MKWNFRRNSLLIFGFIFTSFIFLAPGSNAYADDILLGSFQLSLDNAVTPYNAQNAARALELINGTVISPGEEFSYNDTVGMRTSAKGFISGMISSTSPSAEYRQGGGVCMTSSCLHQAVLAAGLEVVERHNHARRTSYLALGDDAAVWYGVADYRFINNTNQDVYIDGRVIDGNMWIGIKSARSIYNSTLPAHGAALLIDGNKLNSYGPLYIENGTSLIPVEMMNNGMPIWADWKPGNAQFNVYWGFEIVPMEIDKNTTTLYGQTYTLPVPVRMINSQPYIPVQMLSELAGYSLAWDETNRYVLMDKI